MFPRSSVRFLLFHVLLRTDLGQHLSCNTISEDSEIKEENRNIVIINKKSMNKKQASLYCNADFNSNHWFRFIDSCTSLFLC